jgi:ketosteroid isomerase-like protein
MTTRIRALAVGAVAAIAASVAIPALTSAQAPPTRSARVTHAQRSRSQADQLRALERARLHALVAGDTTTAGKVMAGDFQAIPPTGDPLARKDYLGTVAAGVIDYLVFEPVSPIVVRRSGDSAALRYKVSFDIIAGGPGGTRVTHKGWITELWERRAGRWLIVWEQATAIPNNFDLFLQSIEPPAQP